MTMTVPATTALNWPRGLLTIEAWEAWDDPAFRHAELVEGVVQLNPAPMPHHQRAERRIAEQMATPLGLLGWECLAQADVVLVAQFPPIVRQPDISIVRTSLLDSRPRRLSANDVLLAVEIVSPGSARTDRIAKLADYADAGIPHYWIVDITGAPRMPVTLDAYVLDGQAYRRTVHAVGGMVELTEPLSVTIDLDVLVTG